MYLARAFSTNPAPYSLTSCSSRFRSAGRSFPSAFLSNSLSSNRLFARRELPPQHIPGFDEQFESGLLMSRMVKDGFQKRPALLVAQLCVGSSQLFGC